MDQASDLSALRARLRKRHGREKQNAAWRRAAELSPIGVHSNYRYWGPEETPVIARGHGSHLWDLDGNEFIDYRSGFGAVILGHGFEPVCAAVSDAIRQGSVFTLANVWETRAAERMIRLCPVLEMVRFCSSGTEATMHALRLARAYTGREKVMKFEGNFHGVHDNLLFSTAGSLPERIGPREAPIPMPMTRGIPRALTELIVTQPYNHEALLEAAFARVGHELAAVIAEPVMGNAAALTASSSWWATLRRLCDRYGVVFILDEVKTGFRVAPGGAQELYGIKPDLATYAKAMGNGIPVAAFGGKRQIMAEIGPPGVVHGGTFNGNVASMAAVDKVLELLEDGQILAQIGARGERLRQGASALLSQAGIAHVVVGPPQMWGLILAETQPRDFRDVLNSDLKTYTRIMVGLHARGVMPEPDVREPWFMNAAHDDHDIDYTLEALQEVLNTLA